MPGETEIGGQAREFPETRWTLILSSKEGSEPKRKALERLLSDYWKPLYYYVRRKGRNIESAKDLIQGFFAHLLQRDFLERLDPQRGRFRSFLRTSLDHYLANLYEAQSAQKRGGGRSDAALDFQVAETGLPHASDEPSTAFEQEWAIGVMERAMAELRGEFESGSRTGPLESALRFFDVARTPPTYEEAAAAGGMTVSQFKAFLHRTRVRFRDLVRREVSHTVSTEEEIEAEIGELLKALKP